MNLLFTFIHSHSFTYLLSLTWLYFSLSRKHK